MSGNYLDLDNINAYKAAFELSNYVWKVVLKWDFFSKDTVGRQFVRAIDSISANIAEGFGRYGKRDKINFYHYSYGSIKESVDWMEKANVRKLFLNDEYQYIKDRLLTLPRELNALIKFTNEKLQR